MEYGDERQNIYQISRTIKRKENSLYNALRSIYKDSTFVGEISQLWPELPLLANLRCGLWYYPQFNSTCYFKSTDGHTNNWSFNTSRLNLHVALLAGQKGGCIIVDSTRKGKRFPDSMSKTIPIWACVLNRTIFNYSKLKGTINGECCPNWDCSLHLPLWISRTERASIEDRIEEWINQLEASGADIASIASCLKKPLRPLWISHKTLIWLNEIPDYDSWDFTPIILVNSSSSSGAYYHNQNNSEISWNYISGAGDDEESWARGLSPSLFWKHVYEIINSGPECCNMKVADIVEKDRVYRSIRGQNAPQLFLKGSKLLEKCDNLSDKTPLLSCEITSSNEKPCNDDRVVAWLGSTKIAVCAAQHASTASDVDCMLNCDKESVSVCLPNADAYLHLPILTSKFDRFSLVDNLPAAVNFARSNLSKRKTLLICCQDGEDISVCVSLAILTSLYNDSGTFDDGKSMSETSITKHDLRRRLVFICKYAINTRPSRGNLRQVFSFLSSGGRLCSGHTHSKELAVDEQ